MNSRASAIGAWTGGGIVTLLLAAGVPAGLWFALLLLLVLAVLVSG